MAIVTTEDRGAVRHLILNRPEKRNAMHGELVLAIGAALERGVGRRRRALVVLRGDGAMFSSGMDFAASAAWPTSRRPARRPPRDPRRLERARRWRSRRSAQIHGGCIGGAMELALACDLRTMAADAVIGMPETRVGLIPDVGGSSRLPAVVGLGRAKEMIMAAS